MGVAIVIFIVIVLAVGIYDAQPSKQKEREDYFIRNMGVDPDSYEGQMLKAKVASAQIDATLKKQEQKKETKEIIKGAVTGGIIAGEAGAVVGAVVAKNKIDNEKK